MVVRRSPERSSERLAGVAFCMLVSLIVVSVRAEASFLSYVESQSVASAWAVAVSPDGAHVYVAGYGAPIAIFGRDTGTGQLTALGTQAGSCGGAIVVSADGNHLYCSDSPSSSVSVFARNPLTGALTLVETQVNGVGVVDGVSSAGSLVLSPDGAHLYVGGVTASAESYPLAVFGRNQLSGALTFVGLAPYDGPTPYPHSIQVAISPDGAYVYAADLWGVTPIRAYGRNPATGLLTAVPVTPAPMDLGEIFGSPQRFGLSPDGSSAYAIAGSASLMVLSRSASSGMLSPVEMQSAGVVGAEALYGLQAITLSPDGRHVYVGSTGGDGPDSVAVFGRRTDSGMLSLGEIQSDGVGGVDGLSIPRSLALSPDGASLYVAAANDGAVTVFAVNTACGDGVQDAGEGCDDGTANGWNHCCSATCSTVDADGDGTCDRDDGCPHVAGITVASSMTVRKVLLKYGPGGPGGMDDAPRVAKIEFSTTALFDPDSADAVHLRLVNTGPAGGQLFSTKLGGGFFSSWWQQRNPARKRWLYRDLGSFAAFGVKRAVLNESPAGSGLYRFSLVGADANLTAAPLDETTDDIRATLEIESGGAGVCFEATLADCHHSSSRDLCTP